MPRGAKIVLIMGWLALFALACSPTSGSSDGGPLQVGSQITKTPAANTGATPTDTATVLQSLTVDLDGDGSVEQVTATLNDSNALVVRIAQDGSGDSWEHTFREDMSFSSLQAVDVNADKILEVLVNTVGPEDRWYNLALIRWTKEGADLLSPAGGPSAGSQYIRSLYYPASIVDLDGDTGSEIVASVPSDDPEVLHSAVYEWDGHTYSNTEFYILPPRPIPTVSPQP